MSALLYLTYMAVVLLAGIFVSVVANRLRIPNVLLFIITGIILGSIQYNLQPLVSFPVDFVASIGVLAIAIIVFNGASRLKLKEFDDFALKSLKLSLLFLLLNMTFLSFGAYFLFDFPMAYALIFASLMAGTAPEVVLSVLKPVKNKVIELLEIESIVNTPLVVLIPFLIVDAVRTIGEFSSTNILNHLAPFLQQLVAGVGSGVLIGLIVFKIMRRYYNELLSPIAVIAAALLTYVLAENLGGNGVLAVTVMGIFFGTLYVKQKGEIQHFSDVFTYLLMILVFVMVGLLVNMSVGWVFFVKAALLFALSLVLRFIAMKIAVGPEYTGKEEAFLVFTSPKGIAVAVVVLLLSTMNLPNIEPMLDLTLILLLYSVIVSSISIRFSSKMLGRDVIK